MTQINKYQNGKIYRIWSLETDDIYVGSTVDMLHKRMYKHRNDAKKGRTNMKIHLEMQRIGIDSFKIELIENYPCQTIQELHMREGHWIRTLTPSLNQLIAGRTRKEWVDVNKDNLIQKRKERWLINNVKYLARKKLYYEQHKTEILQKQKEYASTRAEHISLYHKEYREKNADKLKELKKLYAEKNKDQLIEKNKKYREENKEKIQAHKSESHICTICGSSYTNCHKARHERTKKHLQALEQQSN
jgi:hypothetical protein